jgi:hypothetical protein
LFPQSALDFAPAFFAKPPFGSQAYSFNRYHFAHRRFPFSTKGCGKIRVQNPNQLETEK